MSRVSHGGGGGWGAVYSLKEMIMASHLIQHSKKSDERRAYPPPPH